MKEFFPVLHTAALFSGISDDELGASGFCKWKKQLRSIEIGRTASARTI